MRASRLSPLSCFRSRSPRSGDAAGFGKVRVRCLPDARAGDRVRLVEAPGKEVRTGLLLGGREEARDVRVLNSGWGGVVLSMDEERRAAAPNRAVQAALVTCNPDSKSTSNTGD